MLTARLLAEGARFQAMSGPNAQPVAAVARFPRLRDGDPASDPGEYASITVEPRTREGLDRSFRKAIRIGRGNISRHPAFARRFMAKPRSTGALQAQTDDDLDWTLSASTRSAFFLVGTCRWGFARDESEAVGPIADFGRA